MVLRIFRCRYKILQCHTNNETQNMGSHSSANKFGYLHTISCSLIQEMMSEVVKYHHFHFKMLAKFLSPKGVCAMGDP